MFGVLSSQRTYSSWDPSKTNQGINNNGTTMLSSASTGGAAGTKLASFGKTYVEITIDLRGGGIGIHVGVWGTGTAIGVAPSFLGNTADSYSYSASAVRENNGAGFGYGATFTTGDNIGIMYDASVGTLEFRKNGVSQGVAYSGIASGLFIAASSDVAGNQVGCTINCGATPFVYSVPSGYNPGLYS